jgi:hypothetical protein
LKTLAPSFKIWTKGDRDLASINKKDSEATACGVRVRLRLPALASTAVGIRTPWIGEVMGGGRGGQEGFSGSVGSFVRRSRYRFMLSVSN